MFFRRRARKHGLTVRMNPCYKRTFSLDRRGFLIVTERWIIAYGVFASAWM